MLNLIRYHFRRKSHYAVILHTSDMLHSLTIIVKACSRLDAECVAYTKLINKHISIKGLPITTVEDI